MIFSYGLVLALFLLAPGFAVVAAIYAAGGPSRMEAAPPPPNSIMALALVTAGALSAHAIAAAAFGLSHLVAWWLRASWSYPDPNPYFLALHPGAAGHTYAAVGLAWMLGLLLLLSVSTYWVVRWALQGPLAANGAVAAALYGWLHELQEDDGALAYVVTSMNLDDAAVGYMGIVDYIVLDSAKQIQSLVLIDAEIFTLVAKGGLVHRVANPRNEKLTRLVLTGGEIKNIVFEPVRFTEEGE